VQEHWGTPLAASQSSKRVKAIPLAILVALAASAFAVSLLAGVAALQRRHARKVARADSVTVLDLGKESVRGGGRAQADLADLDGAEEPRSEEEEATKVRVASTACENEVRGVGIAFGFLQCCLAERASACCSMDRMDRVMACVPLS
jgi:hypothetical protein